MENLTEIQRHKFEKAKKRVKSIAGFYKHFTVYVLVNLFLITLRYFDLDLGEKFFTFGTFSTAFFWGIGLVFHALSVFGPGFFLGNDWEEKKIKEIMEKEKGTKWE